MKELMQDIKIKAFKPLYLLFGEERYLVRLYEAKLRDAIVPPAFEAMNMDIFEGKAVRVEDIEIRATTLPFMCERRLLIVRESGLFAAGRKDESERIAEFFKHLPPDTVIVFVEDDVDKRSKAYKQAAANGLAVEFSTPSENELVAWVSRQFKEQGKSIMPQNAATLLRYVAFDMYAAASEVAKLSAYIGSAADIAAADIEAVCVKSVEARIFELVDAVANKDAPKALERLDNLLAAKESPLMVIVMIARQFRIMLMCKECAAQGLGTEATAAATGLRSFVVSAALKQSRGFDEASLINALQDCAETDNRIKTGKIQDRLGVEMLIVRHSSR
ncbi:MAG: DNA polymerase III subunit delta [Defluviitaleaceae bacterium]|nr:DNA polymerase III subunit delta [Defluviitaleaceae bacterium]